MNDFVINEVSKKINVSENSVRSVLKLLSDGSTIPFIARYRKEVTGNLDEEQIRSISEVYDYQVNLLKRKEDVIRLIDEKGLLTPELKDEIMKCDKLVLVEDLYRPFKDKKKTKATDAIDNGLTPLAKMIMAFPLNGSLDELASRFVNDKVKTAADALIGASYIIAEWISDNAYYRKWIRNYVFNNGTFVTKKIGDDDAKLYEMYYDFSESVKYIKSYRYLAINRAVNEKVVSLNIDVDKDYILNYLFNKIIKNSESFVIDFVKDAIKDAFKRLIFPSVVREIKGEVFLRCEDEAIGLFSRNLENLLLTPPMKEKIVLALDPAFRTGCKIGVLDKTGKPLYIGVIYPHEPKCEYEKSKKIILELIDKFDVDIIAIGNGTASRESEAFIVDVIKDSTKDVKYVIVSESGASVYSASKLAISEFPDLHVEERSAISIGRRLQDPLSEYVKIDPKSIGVGQYQHDVSSKKLEDGLDFVVSKVVNSVGVNINTASQSLLRYVSGLSKKLITSILDYRNKFGKFDNREEVKSLKGMSSKSYEQCIGFLRIVGGSNVLDMTSIHPESYAVALKLLNKFDIDVETIGSEEVRLKFDNLNLDDLSDVSTDKYLLFDIIESLKKPLRDPRDELEKPILKSDILKIENLTVGMKLEGTVRNVVDFGVFIDVGLKNDGLAHISKLTKSYIKHPSDILAVGDIVSCYVLDVDLDKNKFSLSLIDPLEEN